MSLHSPSFVEGQFLGANSADFVQPHIENLVLGERSKSYEDGLQKFNDNPFDLHQATYNEESVSILVDRLNVPNARMFIGKSVRTLVTYKLLEDGSGFVPKFKMLAEQYQTPEVLAVPVEAAAVQDEGTVTPVNEDRSDQLFEIAKLARNFGLDFTLSPASDSDKVELVVVA